MNSILTFLKKSHGKEKGKDCILTFQKKNYKGKEKGKNSNFTFPKLHGKEKGKKWILTFQKNHMVRQKVRDRSLILEKKKKNTL